jgi:hypothetical protein
MKKTKQDWFNEYLSCGYSFFGTGSFEKKIITKWTQFQTKKPSNQELAYWLKSPIPNIALVCGKLSNVIVFDVDTKNGADPTPFLNKGMYEVRTPSGGYHFYCQYEPQLRSVPGKLRSDFLKGIDIQSEGKLIFLPPSTFENGTYTVVNDVPVGKIPDDLLVKVLDALTPEKESKIEYKPLKPEPHHYDGNAKPSEIFNALASWCDVLLPLGWTPIRHIRQQGVQYWRRPGKKDGVSASTNYDNSDLLFVYSTSTELSTDHPYNKFQALAYLKYNGDYKKCARELVMQSARLASNYILNK